MVGHNALRRHCGEIQCTPYDYCTSICLVGRLLRSRHSHTDTIHLSGAFSLTIVLDTTQVLGLLGVGGSEVSFRGMIMGTHAPGTPYGAAPSWMSDISQSPILPYPSKQGIRSPGLDVITSQKQCILDVTVDIIKIPVDESRAYDWSFRENGKAPRETHLIATELTENTHTHVPIQFAKRKRKKKEGKSSNQKCPETRRSLLIEGNSKN